MCVKNEPGASVAFAIKRRGMALLEVIVALVLLSSTGLALFAWINQNLATAGRLAESDARARLTLNALALVETLNPADRPSGEFQLAAMSMSWRSRIVQPMLRSQGPGEAPGLWWVALYSVDVTASTTGSDTSVRFTLQRPGWQRHAPLVAGS